jgi:hypothetical protein
VNLKSTYELDDELAVDVVEVLVWELLGLDVLGFVEVL